MNGYQHTLTLVLCCAACSAGADEPPYLQPGAPATSPPISYHHASTYEEGVLRGSADLRRAVGEQNYNNALARVYQQEAIRRAIYNRKQAVQTYFDVKEVNREYRAKYRRTPPTPEQLEKFNASALPPRLSSQDYNMSTGTLVWPAMLRSNLFELERRAVDTVMSARTANNSGLGTPSFRQIKQLSSTIEDKIRRLGNQVTSAERIAARKFLKSLAYEARLPASVDPAGLAIK